MDRYSLSSRGKVEPKSGTGFIEDLWTMTVAFIFMLGAVALGMTVAGGDAIASRPWEQRFFQLLFGGPFVVAFLLAIHKALPKTGVGGAVRGFMTLVAIGVGFWAAPYFLAGLLGRY